MGGLFSQSKPIGTQVQQMSGIRVQSSCYGRPIPIVYGRNRLTGNLIWYGDFNAIPQTSNTSAGGKGGGGGNSSPTSYTYQAALAFGICEGPIAGFGQFWVGKELHDAATDPNVAATFNGTYPQSPWGYLTSKHPGEDLSYAGLAYITWSAFNLDSSAAMPNLSFEISGKLPYGGGIVDANPKDVVVDFLPNTGYGALFPASKIGDLSQYSAYCVANGIFLSPVMDTQKPANSYLTDILKVSNSEVFFSEGLMKIVPYGDQTVTGNGVTFTPNATPWYDLTDDDFLPDSNGVNPPVTCDRSDQVEAYNRVQVEFMNRANAYNIDIADAPDQADIDDHGLHLAPVYQAHSICDASVARNVAQLMLQRVLYIRNVYKFKLSLKFARLEPMDLVTLTDSGLELDKEPVRITEIIETNAGEIEITAEEYPSGVSSHAVYQTQETLGYNANYNVVPASVNMPVFFEAPVELAATGLELWAAISSSDPNWGGAEVWVSSDGNTYKKAGALFGGSRQGILTSGLASSFDPDTLDTASVSLTESNGTLLSGTQNDADLFHTLCLVENELISYQTATLTSAHCYNLSYLRRGAYDTPIKAHAAGSSFVRVDDAIFKYPYSKEQIGQTLYIKCLSFNVWGGGLQGLADVTPYTHVLKGPNAPSNVKDFSCQQNGGSVIFKWSQIPDYALKGYDIRFGPQGTTNWDLLVPLTESARGTEMTNAGVPPGSWTFAIKARDVTDQFSAQMTTADLVVINESPVVLSDPQEPAWPGTLTGFVRHWTGVLVPMGTKTCDQYSAWEDFNTYVPDPVASATYEMPMADTGFDDTLRVWASIAAALGYGQSGTASIAFQIDTWLTGQADPNSFTSWTVGEVSMRYLRARLVMTVTAGSVFYLTDFTPTADRGPKVENGGNLTVAASGTAVTFPAPYHQPPLVQLTVVGASALIPTAVNITTTGFTAHVYDTTGADVGGTVNWTATGN